MFYMVMFLPTPPILSDTLNSRDPCVPTVGRYHVLTVILVDGAFSKDSRCTAACAAFIPISAIPTVCPIWAGHRKAAPPREVTPGCGQLENGEDRGECASQPHITSTSPSPELANVSICIEF